MVQKKGPLSCALMLGCMWLPTSRPPAPQQQPVKYPAFIICNLYHLKCWMRCIILLLRQLYWLVRHVPPNFKICSVKCGVHFICFPNGHPVLGLSPFHQDLLLPAGPVWVGMACSLIQWCSGISLCHNHRRQRQCPHRHPLPVSALRRKPRMKLGPSV